MVSERELRWSMSRCCFAVLAICCWCSATHAANRGKLEIRVVDPKANGPVAVRMHLKDQKGKVVKPPKIVAGADHIVFEDQIQLELPTGNYFFELERGLEYKTYTGQFFLENGASDSKEIKLDRFLRMADEGWYSGDLDLACSPSDVELLMKADDLYCGPLTTWHNNQEPKSTETAPIRFDRDRWYQLFTGRDAREGGGLLFFGLSTSLPLPPANREHPASAELLSAAREGGANAIAALHTNAWDLPMWLANGNLDTVLVLNRDLQRNGFATKDVGTKPRDTFKFPNPLGVGRWNQEIYYSLLNCGLRIPPAAGSGAGEVANPVGYNRVYVQCEGELSWEKWWSGLKQGRVVVTNGPLMQPKINDQFPGHVFQAEAGKTVELSVALNLATREKIDYLELVKNGVVVEQVRLDKWAENNGVLPTVKFEESGWLLVRAVTNNATTYRYAMSGPVYVEIGYQPRISRSAVKFFSEWVVERAKRLKFEDATQREAVVAYHRRARDYWQTLLEKANAD